MRRALPLLALLAAVLTARPAAPEETLNGYAEYRRGAVLIVDGQRVRAGAGLRFRGEGQARGFDTIPLGYEMKVHGARAPDGAVVAREVEAKPNGLGLFENDLRVSFDQAEQRYREARHFYSEGANGKRIDIGSLEESGPQVQRVRAITRDLCPPYLRSQDFRVYVVDNREWNAMAAPNRSIYVFSGLLSDMDDDEVAIVLGHELTHATHEHSRRAFKKQIIIMLSAAALAAAEQEIDDKGKRIGAQLATLLAASAISNGYGRGQEDQADRVGLRYAHEGGYDVRKGPKLWKRFAVKYGNPNKAVNFFFGDHSVAEARARNLERELAINYRE
jgi:Zn-dependent protease with chaperone function